GGRAVDERAAHGLLQALAVITVLCVAPGGGGDLVEEVRGADLEQGRVHAVVRPGDRQEEGDAAAPCGEHLGFGRIGDDRVASATVGESVLDVADVVDGDPVGTGYGHVVLAFCGIGARVPRERVSRDHTKGVMSWPAARHDPV